MHQLKFLRMYMQATVQFKKKQYRKPHVALYALLKTDMHILLTIL